MVAMEKFDKILELLEKQNLTESDQKLLEQYTNSDKELNSVVEVYKKLKTCLSGNGHISTDLLASYVLYEMGENEDNKTISILSRKVSSHLKECTECKKEYEELKNEYTLIGEHIVNALYQNAQSRSDNFIFSSFFKRTSTFKYAFAVLAVLIVSYVGLFFISTSTTPEYKTNLFNDTTEDSYLTRGRTSPLFQQGLNAIEEKDYSKAIEFLSQDINEHKNDKSIFYSHYILGLTHLRASESDFLGLFKSYNNKNVDFAITNLQAAIGKNNSGSYESLKLDAYYYLGRAYLLVDNRDLAVSSLQKVIDEKGKFAREAQQLISDLEKN